MHGEGGLGAGAHPRASLSEDERQKFTWEAATERPVESLVVVARQATERAEVGMDKVDAMINLLAHGERG